MSRSLTASLSVGFNWNYTETTDLAAATASQGLTITDSLTSGITLDKADRMFADTRSVAASSNDDIDLSGSLTDPLGQTVTFGKIKGLLLKNKSTTAGDVLQVSGNGAAGFTTWLKDNAANSADGVRVGPDGCLMLWNPSLAAYSVTATTADILRITELGGANTVSYDLVLIGTNS